MTDPLADLLTRIKNGYMTGKKEVECPLSHLKLAVLKILESSGFIEKVSVSGYTMKILLKYQEKKPLMENFKRVSKPGMRVYIKHQEIRRGFRGLGISIISTPSGVMSDKDAKKQKLGGELLCQVW